MLSLHTSPLARLGRTRDAGGMNVYVRELSRELGRGGILVDVFTRWNDPADPPIEPLGERVRLIRIAAGPIAPLPTSELFPHVAEFVRHVRRFAERAGHPYDLVHSHYWLSGVAGMTLARLWDAPHVAMFHTVERLKGERLGEAAAALTPAGERRADYEGRIAASADCVTVATAHERDQLERIYGLGASRFEIIPCGVDLDRFTPGTAAQRHTARTRLETELGLRGGDPVLLAVGRLDPIKGSDLLLEAVSQMRTPANLVLVGGNPDGDPELERLRGRAAALGLAERVRFPGAVAQEALPRYYRAADALVVASRYESFGLVAVEALASGTPVVASKVGGLPSIVRDGTNGLLIPWRCPGAFAEGLDALLGDPARLRRFGAAARPSVERFGWQRIGDQVRARYQELTSAHRCAEACCCF
ncbi:MAG TPA: glycosyltransferase [Ktedonobacterales bacterium]|jgi:D-inositol-3-phosphate glycosyltransferase